MAEFRIPKGKPYEFTIRVVAKDSFLAQDLTDGLGLAIATFELIDWDTMIPYGDPFTGVVQGDPLDGIVKFTLDSTYTNSLEVARGEKVDGYYLKPGYQGVITITFDDTTIEDRVTTIEKVYVVPAGTFINEVVQE